MYHDKCHVKVQAKDTMTVKAGDTSCLIIQSLSSNSLLFTLSLIVWYIINSFTHLIVVYILLLCTPLKIHYFIAVCIFIIVSSSFTVPSGVMISRPCRTSYQSSPFIAIPCVPHDSLHDYCVHHCKFVISLLCTFYYFVHH